MRRLLPYPLLAASLFVMWLLLTQSFAPGQIVLGAIASLIATASTAALRRPQTRIGSWRAIAKLAVAVAADIVRSNIAVARIALAIAPRRHSSFIRMHLELRDQQALAILALIITATPGTAWIQYTRSDGMLLIHVFDLVDEEGWKRLLKTRYERLLMEIFEP